MNYIISPLLLFYVIIMANYSKELISKQVKSYIKSNRLVQHLIGFITMVILISVIGTELNVNSIIFYSVIGYILFIFSTKLDIDWNLIFIVLLFIWYLYDRHIQTSEKQLMNDPNVEMKNKLEIKETNYKHEIYATIAIIAVILTGTLLYSCKKIEQYGGSHNMITYLLY